MLLESQVPQQEDTEEPSRLKGTSEMTQVQVREGVTQSGGMAEIVTCFS